MKSILEKILGSGLGRRRPGSTSVPGPGVQKKWAWLEKNGGDVWEPVASRVAHCSVRTECLVAGLRQFLITDLSGMELRLHVDACRESPAEAIEKWTLLWWNTRCPKLTMARRNGCRTV